MYNISVLDKVKKPGIVTIDRDIGRFQHELDYHGASSPRSDRSLVLDLAPPLYYPGSRSKIYDRSPYGNHGTITTPTWVRRLSGLWYQNYNGTTDKTVVADAPSIRMGVFTLMAWVEIVSPLPGGTGTIMGKFNKVIFSRRGFWCHHAAGGTNKFVLQISNAGATWPTHTINSDDAYTTAGWYFVITTNDGSFLTLEVNNVQAATPVASAVALTGADDLWVGRNVAANTDSWKGGIALPRAINVALPLPKRQEIFRKERHFFGR